MALETISGQDAAVEVLRRALRTGRVAHAYTFVGPGGVGRKRVAIEFAKTLVAPQGGPAAERVERGAHPDVFVVEPTPPPDNPKGVLRIRIENIRELERLAVLRPAQAAWKVFIVHDAEAMTPQTQHAFLKTLEEPPARTIIILIVSRLRALLATVRSRCQIIRFTPITPEGTLALLPDGRGEERMRALQFLWDAEQKGAEAIFYGSEALERNREKAEAVVEACWLWYRDLLCAEGGGAARLAVYGAHDPLRRDGAQQLTLDDVVKGLDACREAWQAIQGNVSPRLTVEVLLTRLGRRAA